MRAAIYIRKSREDKNKAAYRLTYQRQYLPEYARQQGWQASLYDDGHASAARGKTEDLKKRAQLEKDIKAGNIDIVLVIELSRLSRDESLQDYVTWLTLCADQGVKLATTGRILDPSQHSDWMLLLMEGGFSSVEMKMISGRMKEGRQSAFLAGKWLGGSPPPPYVYDKAQGRPVINPDDLPLMQKIWSLAESMPAKAIAEKLKKPEIFVRRSISDNRLLFYQALREDPETGDTIKCDWEPVMNARQAKKIKTGRRTRKTVGAGSGAASLLSNLNLLYCAYCGRTIKTWQNSKKRSDGTQRTNYYGCQSKNKKNQCKQSRLIAQPVIDNKLLTNLFGTLENIEELRTSWEAEQARLDPAAVLNELAREEKQEKEKKKRLVSAISSGVIEFVDAKDEMESINTAIEDIKTRRENMLQRASDPPSWNDIKMTPDLFKKLCIDEQREFIKAVLKEVKIYSSYMILTYRFPRSSDGGRTTRIHLPPPQRGVKHT